MQDFTYRGGGQMVRMFALYSEDLSLNRVEVFIFYSVKNTNKRIGGLGGP